MPSSRPTKPTSAVTHCDFQDYFFSTPIFIVTIDPSTVKYFTVLEQVNDTAKIGLGFTLERDHRNLLARLFGMKTKWASKIKLTKMLYQKGFDKNKVHELLRFIDWLIQVPEEIMIQYHNQIEEIEWEQKMTYITSFEKYGFHMGQQSGESKALNILLKQKFKTIPQKYKKLIQIAKSEELATYLKRVLSANTLEEIFI